MLPTLTDGDRLLVSYRRSRRGRVRPGAVVVARFADGTIAVKRVAGRRVDGAGATAWWLLSDNLEEGVDSRHRGAVPDHDILAVAFARIWPRPRPIHARTL